MKKLYIISAGDFGREVLEWALAMPAHSKDWEVAGFLDTRPDALRGYTLPVGIVGSPATWEVREDHLFVCALGNPVEKMKFVGMIQGRGGRFANIIHPTAIIGRNSRIGQGCILCPHVIITVNVTLADFVIMNYYSCAGHDAVIGEGVTLGPHCDITGHVKLGKGVYLGSHATVLPKGVVEDFGVVGAGSVVLSHVKANTTVLGVPAKEVYHTDVV